MEKYIEKNGKKLRYGYTTGSCATAVSKACAIALFKGEILKTVNIDTPKGWLIDIDVYNLNVDYKTASAFVIKDAGDDPDMTNGMKIYAHIKKRLDNLITITGGEGIGKVTKPGLSVEIGKSAINPIPMKMIEEHVRRVIGDDNGLDIIISAPEGVEIAKRTFNPKLGIVGGVSIIGTTGIVEPMSEDAIIETIKIELSVFKRTYPNRILLLSPGNYGRDFAAKLGIDTKDIIKTSNYIGFVIDEALRLGIKKILFVSHSGKMIKVAGGNFQTHSKMSDSRMEIIAAYLGTLGATPELIVKVLDANTSDEAIDIVAASDYMNVFEIIAKKCSEKCNGRAFDEIEFGTILFTNKHGKIAACDMGIRFMEELINE